MSDEITDPKGAEEMAIVMGYEAMRICLGQETRYYPTEEVFLWMKEVMKAGNPIIATDPEATYAAPIEKFPPRRLKSPPRPIDK